MKIQPPEPQHVGWLIAACLLVLILSQVGCATKYTPEMEQAIEQNCQEGCAVVPAQIWMQILQRLQGVSA